MNRKHDSCSNLEEHKTWQFGCSHLEEQKT